MLFTGISVSKAESQMKLAVLPLTYSITVVYLTTLFNNQNYITLK